MTDIRFIEIERMKSTPDDWDAFAIRCNASHRELDGWIWYRQIRSHVLFRVVRYNILLREAGRSIKIGQFAIGHGPLKRIFSDGLQLLPEYRDTWAACMEATLRTLGRGRYVYGSDWSFEPPRESIFASMAGVTITSVEKYMTEAVDFSRWTSWEDYQKAVSSNIRRTIKNAKTELDPFEIDIRYGASSVEIFPRFHYSKFRMLKRKLHKLRRPRRLNFLLLLNPTHYFLRILLSKHRSVSAILSHKGQVIASFSGVEIGQTCYFFEGGSVESNGAGWLLNMSLMHDFYLRHPTGRFVLGCLDRSDDQSPDGWESPVRYRSRARVSGFPSSRVTFTYSA
ncbi:hypothetical protein HPT29_013710 [Microvirga terrae]|uniref:GNAT family N-acetyltransferase n=1 Tax=Microvirga terrae TaxID=2740529 RepID=A0ABY5RMI7_9HYPH|nr:hypothetical protein [Microvirga terrae]UVF17601.1 hypothetical protein HPT29_013710 [Microvirga terrae]